MTEVTIRNLGEISGLLSAQLTEVAALLRAQLKVQRMMLTIVGRHCGNEQKLLDDLDESVMRHYNEELARRGLR